jgi:hypothetical protein
MSKGNGEDILKRNEEKKMDSSPIAIKPSKPCICPKCGKLVPSQMETPCYKRSCPKCESKMLSL